MFSKYELFPWIEYFSSDPPQTLIFTIPHPKRFPAPRHLCQISHRPTETPLQRKPHHMFFIGFLYLVLPHLTTRHNYWIYQTLCQAKPIKFIAKLYTNHNTLLVKHATYQKAELDSTVNDNSIFNTKYALQSHSHYHTCVYNHPFNLHQKIVSPLQLISTSLFHPYLFIKSSSQSPLTLPSSIPQQFFISVFLHATIPTTFIISIFPTSTIWSIQAASCDQ